jgi:hypothetical protein
MASDEHVATALNAFAKALVQGSHVNLTTGSLLSEDQEAVRRKRLHDLSARVQAMAASPRTATYQGFERFRREAQELGAEVASEVLISVASAFMQRPHTSSRIAEGAFSRSGSLPEPENQ